MGKMNERRRRLILDGYARALVIRGVGRRTARVLEFAANALPGVIAEDCDPEVVFPLVLDAWSARALANHLSREPASDTAEIHDMLVEWLSIVESEGA